MRVITVRRAATALVLVVLASVSRPFEVDAQVTTGSIVGTVTDPAGQPIPGAQVSIEDLDKGTSVSVVSDANGSFAAPFLIPGTYTVSVELQGFRKWVHSGVILQVNDRLRVDAALEVGRVEEAR